MDQTGYDLLRALQQPGCPICTFTAQSVHAYLDSISYESVNDLGVRDQLRNALGYCAVHGQEWLGLQNALGTAIIYHDVCTHILRVLEEQMDRLPADGGGLRGRWQGLVGGGTAGGALALALAPSAPCPACRHADQVEAQAITACAPALAHPPFLEAYAAHATGLCLPHFRAVLPQVRDAGVLRQVVAAQIAHFQATDADLREVIRKFDYRFTKEARGAEFEAPARSVTQVAGQLPSQLNPPKAPR